MGKEMKSVIASGVFFLVLIVCAIWYVNDKSGQVDQRKSDIAALEGEIDSLKKEAALHPALEQELENLKANVATYVKILPSPDVATEERLLELVQEKSERSQFTLTRYSRLVQKKRKGKKKKGGPAKKKKGAGGFQEVGLNLGGVGTYEEFLRFLNSLERHESFLRVNSFTCRAAQQGKGGPAASDEQVWPLDIQLNVSTFRYQAGQ